MDDRARRIAENEIRFREINERVRASLDAFLGGDEEPVDFVCECGHASCSDAVPLTVGEYEVVRRDGARFLVLPGHEIPDVERVVERGNRFFVLEKDMAARDLARQRDPRGEHRISDRG